MRSLSSLHHYLSVKRSMSCFSDPTLNVRNTTAILAL